MEKGAGPRLLSYSRRGDDIVTGHIVNSGQTALWIYSCETSSRYTSMHVSLQVSAYLQSCVPWLPQTDALCRSLLLTMRPWVVMVDAADYLTCTWCRLCISCLLEEQNS